MKIIVYIGLKMRIIFPNFGISTLWFQNILWYNIRKWLQIGNNRFEIQKKECFFAKCFKKNF